MIAVLGTHIIKSYIKVTTVLSEKPGTVFECRIVYIIYSNITRNSEGVYPVRLRNIRLNAEIEEKPEASATSVIEMCGSRSRFFAYVMRL